MSTLISWLEAELEKAKREKEEADRRVEFCAEALERAKAEKGVAARGKVGDARLPFHQTPLVPQPRVKMVDQISEILKDHGRLSTQRIFEYLKSMVGRERTTYNSVNNLLYKHRGTKFAKYQDGSWNIVSTSHLIEEEFSTNDAESYE